MLGAREATTKLPTALLYWPRGFSLTAEFWVNMLLVVSRAEAAFPNCPVLVMGTDLLDISWIAMSISWIRSIAFSTSAFSLLEARNIR